MCGWSILSLESYQGKVQKKTHLKWTSFLRAKAWHCKDANTYQSYCLEKY